MEKKVENATRPTSKTTEAKLLLARKLYFVILKPLLYWFNKGLYSAGTIVISF